MNQSIIPDHLFRVGTIVRDAAGVTGRIIRCFWWVDMHRQKSAEPAYVVAFDDGRELPCCESDLEPQ